MTVVWILLDEGGLEGNEGFWKQWTVVVVCKWVAVYTFWCWRDSAWICNTASGIDSDQASCPEPSLCGPVLSSGDQFLRLCPKKRINLDSQGCSESWKGIFNFSWRKGDGTMALLKPQIQLTCVLASPSQSTLWSAKFKTFIIPSTGCDMVGTNCTQKGQGHVQGRGTCRISALWDMLIDGWNLGIHKKDRLLLLLVPRIECSSVACRIGLEGSI